MSDENTYSDPAVRAAIREVNRPTAAELNASLHAALQEEAEQDEAYENETIKLRVTSFHAVRFRVELDTGIPRKEWRELSTEAQDRICTATVLEQEAISITVLGDD